MSDTLGSLIDKLSIVNVKLFMVQEVVHNAAASGEGLDSDTVKKLHVLNSQRNRLITEIDLTFAGAVESGRAEVDHRVKLE